MARRDHPHLAAALDRELRAGTLVAVLPGVYASAAVARDPRVRIAALMRRHPDAVLTGAAAARVFWPSVPLPTITFAAAAEVAPRAGFLGVRRRIPPDWVCVRGAVRYTDPALTAVDLCDEVGVDGIDAALRTRASTLARMRAALDAVPGRRGHRLRRALLLDSRDEPWSAAERTLHRLLRSAGCGGWRANHEVVVGGRRFFLDVAFPAARLAVEVDGRAVHDTAEAFESDRARQNALVLAGWTVLRFTWRMLADDPELVLAQILAALGHGGASDAR
ncbi:very-short-patch-repair endonuclease [Friedmanniella endophytica]|uniref:Very-short-patch-repair endonuclease n=1 Tax=Microlunatus kandeliicorticis TaxID=1759536 RepID=A0A7W3IVN7_9ACTN|nr:DUF559 domain-containing protein [Microlunatus kandeliicorticis]MBA8796102.1 very-short-patch-repair endonuclease [Microlunatus kandeliicorticis]